MKKTGLLAAIALFGLIVSCGNSSQKAAEGNDSTIAEKDAELTEGRDSVYLGKKTSEADKEEDKAIVSRSFDVGKFSSLVVAGPLEVTFVESEKNSVEIKTTEEQMEKLVCELNNGILKIHMTSESDGNVVVDEDGNMIIDGNNVVIGNNNFVGNTSVNHGDIISGDNIVGNNNGNTINGDSSPIKITVKGKLSKKLEVAACCKFTANSIETSRKLDIEVSSSAVASIENLASQDLDIESSSSAILQISKITAKDVDVNASSAAVITMSVECDDIDIEASSAASCVVSGKAKSVETEETSAGTINISGLRKS